MIDKPPKHRSAKTAATIFAAVAALALTHSDSFGRQPAAENDDVAVGPQYDTTHVYIDAKDFDRFVASFTATFEGKASPRITANVLPVPSNAQLQYVWSPVGTLSTFAFQTPIPYPFGQERTGYLVTDMDQALKAVRKAGGEVIVDKFKDPIGFDAVIQWPGGVKMQLYWHFTPPSYSPLQAIPENRVYVSPDKADEFARDFVRFAHGKITSDNRRTDAAEIGRAGEFYRRIRIESKFGKMRVAVTDGHLPYPFGRESTGYEVKDLARTLERAKAAGVAVLSAPLEASDRTAAIVEFPGGYIAEVHSLKSPSR